jgi:heme exporter protein B
VTTVPSWQVARAIAAKDLRIEVRSRSVLTTVFPFAATMLLAFGFALGPGRDLLVPSAPGLLWLAGLFASVDLFGRSYQGEADSGALESLLLAPIDRGAIYLGKAAAAAVQLTGLLLLTGGLVVVLFGLPLGPQPALLLLTVLLGVIGLSALGSLFGLLTILGRTRHVALPVLVLPLVTPVVISAIRATALLGTGDDIGQVGGWLGLLVAFDAAFLATGYLVFGHLLED